MNGPTIMGKTKCGIMETAAKIAVNKVDWVSSKIKKPMAKFMPTPPMAEMTVPMVMMVKLRDHKVGALG